MIQKYFLKTVFATLVLITTTLCFGQIKTYNFTLNGNNESPPNGSTATETATITINVPANTMRVQATFSGLSGNTTACHLHAATATANSGTSGVATQTPYFSGFPIGVTSGTYDNTFDMTLAASYNPSYVTASGGTTALAFAALTDALDASKSYFNIHSNTFPGGEMRGFSVASSLSTSSFDLSSKLQVYPNPAANILNFSKGSTNSSYLIYNATGQIIGRGKIVDNKVSVSNLVKGEYVISVNENGVSTNTKFIKK